MKINLLFGVLLLLIPLKGSSQESPTLPDVVPPSPDVAAFATYTDIPVSESTGVPNISVPIIQLEGKDISIPVSISYHSGGIRVNQFASSVGLGWSLNAGGSISKSIRGRGDCENMGFINPSMTVDEYNNLSGTEKSDFTQENHKAAFPVDFQSDVYYFNFLNYSGKFYLKQLSNGDFEILQEQKSDITFTPYKSGNCFDSWIVTTTDGSKFYFGKSSDGLRTATNNVTSVSGPSNAPVTIHNTESWELLEIVTATNDVISFDYDFEFFDYHSLTSQNYIYQDLNNNGVSTYFTYSTYTKRRLKSIISTKGSVDFNYNLNRIDLEGSKALTKIELKDYNNNLIDSYELEYDYFTTTSNGNVFFDTDGENKNRLRLNRVIQKKENQENKIHRFEYNNQTLPNRFSFSQDFWGFYNGKSNFHLFPKAYDNFGHLYRESPVGGDRSVDAEKAKAGILEKIVYPTGGFTKFIYESNVSPDLPGGNTFGTDSYDQVFINSYSTQSTEPFVPTDLFILPADFNTYEGGYNISMSFTQACTGPTGLECPYARIYLVDNSGNESLYQEIRWNESNQQEVNLIPSLLPNSSNLNAIKVVTFKGAIDLLNQSEIDINFTVIGNKTPDGGFKVGGLRIKNIQFYSEENQIEKEKEYHYTLFNDNSTSSGSVLNPQVLLVKNGIRQINHELCTTVPKDILRSNSVIPTINASSPILYTNVTVIDKDYLTPSQSIRQEKTFLVPDISNWHDFGLINCPEDACLSDVTPNFYYSHRQGVLINHKKYAAENGSYRLVNELINTYNPIATNSGLNIIYKANEYIFPCSAIGLPIVQWFFVWSNYSNFSERYLLTQSKEINYFESDSIVYTTDYSYDDGYYSINAPKSIVSNRSDNEKIIITHKYPNDLLSPSLAEQKLISQNRISTPIETTTIVTNMEENILSQQTLKTIFKDWGNDIVFPEMIRTQKENKALEDRIIYHAYDDLGNPLEVSQANGGSHIVYLWGYNQQYPVAKIENATYSQVLATGVDISILNDANSTDVQRTAELNKVRHGLTNSLVSTYLYDPLIGVTSMTDPRGYTMTYHYDTFNRLEYVRDQDGKILSKNVYNYINN